MRIRRTATATLALALALGLTGCGEDKDKDSDDSPNANSSQTADDLKVLTVAEAKKALISLDDIDGDFKKHVDDDDDDSSMGCLDDLDKIDSDDTDAEAKAEAEYEADSEAGLPLVFSSVASLKDAEEVAKTMDEFRDAVENCTEIDETDEDGTVIKLKIQTTSGKTSDEVTDQINLSATGTFTIQGSLTVPFSMHISIIQLDNNVALAGVGTISDDATDDADAVNEVALEKLLAVIKGETADPDKLDLHIVTENDILQGAA